MKIALISDIHGNLPALEAVYDDIRRSEVGAIYNLGDSLYGPLWPEETARFLIEKSIPSIMGNGDEVLLADPRRSETVRYTCGCLSEDSWDWLRGLAPALLADVASIDVASIDAMTMVHGSPRSNGEYLLEKVVNGMVYVKSEEEIAEAIAGLRSSLIACGHSHVARIVAVKDHVVVNAGSVGLPAYADDEPPHKMESYNAFAAYAIVDGGTMEIRSVRYDAEEAAERAECNGRRDWAAWLRTGRA